MRATIARIATFGRGLAVFAIVAFAASTALAQQPAATRPAGGPLPRGRIAIINAAAFQSGVLELNRKIVEINARFEPKTKELLAIRDRMQGIETQVQQGTVAAAQAAQLKEQYDGLKREYDRKVEDLKLDAQKAYAASATPIEEKVRASLNKYATEKGIVLVMEIGGSNKIGSIIYAAPGLDITADFIAQYNKANP
jgi:Skp family chaperone for outer membrane proteins